MSFSRPDFSAQKASKAMDVDVSRCKAFDCRLRATVNLGGQGFCCGAHAFANTQDWPAITRSLHEFDWLVEFTDEVQRMDQRCQDWRAFASAFWANSDEACQPHDLENAIPYQNRMRGELLFRVGQLPKRPNVRLPREARPAGHFAMLDAA